MAQQMEQQIGQRYPPELPHNLQPRLRPYHTGLHLIVRLQRYRQGDHQKHHLKQDLTAVEEDLQTLKALLLLRAHLYLESRMPLPTLHKAKASTRIVL